MISPRSPKQADAATYPVISAAPVIATGATTQCIVVLTPIANELAVGESAPELNLSFHDARVSVAASK